MRTHIYSSTYWSYLVGAEDFKRSALVEEDENVLQVPKAALCSTSSTLVSACLTPFHTHALKEAVPAASHASAVKALLRLS
jgi:hypothetical protein